MEITEGQLYEKLSEIYAELVPRQGDSYASATVAKFVAKIV